MFHIDGTQILVHFMNKKSLLPVTEITAESMKLIEMIGQQILVGVTSVGSKDANVRDQSKYLLEKTLPELAPALYKGMTLATIDFKKASGVLS
mmetsp:Transcript_20742/g.28002  ORF Transcript_20742/g.28002 Transcript_20742/m.28002 type:complete len:93 (+) Transcript_20742:818-1096(+)